MEQLFDIRTEELELKYSAEDIKLADFVKFAEASTPEKRLEIASWDIYYSGSGLPFEFVRFRNGPGPELTIKIKTDDKNNNHRTEVDLPLLEGVPEWLVMKFVSLMGFKENFRVYKYCDIYYFEKIDVVYYIIYDKNMQEVGRRVEIEARKDYPFKSAEEAIAEVKAMEQKMSAIGITPQKRMKKSNWEQFKK